MLIPAIEIVLANVPLPEYTPVIVALPVIVKPAAPSVAVPVRVNVLLTLAACAPAQASSAKTKVENVRFIGLLESSTLRTRKCGEFGSSSTTPVPVRRANLQSLPQAQVPVYPRFPSSLAQSTIDSQDLPCHEIRRC